MSLALNVHPLLSVSIKSCGNLHSQGVSVGVGWKYFCTAMYVDYSNYTAVIIPILDSFNVDIDCTGCVR